MEKTKPHLIVWKKLLNLKKKGINIAYMCIPAVLILFALLSPEKDLNLIKDNVFSMNGGWKVEDGNAVMENVTLPYKIGKDAATGAFTITRVINEDIGDGMYLKIRASMQDVEVTAKGDVIYESSRENSGWLTFPEVSMWHFVKLPRGMVGETLSIRFTSSIDTFKGVINPISYGTEGAMLKNLISKNLMGLLVSVIMLIAGIIFIIMSFVLRRLDDRRLFYLGIFAVTGSTWMFSEMRILQFVTGNRFILGGISYLMVPLMVLAVLRYLGVVVLMDYMKTIRLLSVIIYGCFYFLLFFQIGGLLPFISGMVFVNAFMSLVVLWILVVIFYEAIWQKNERAVKYGIYVSVLIVAAIGEFFVFFTKDFDNMVIISEIGYGLFIIFQFMESLNYFSSVLALNQKTKILEEMAYKDILVDGHNRAEYEKDLDKLLDSKQCKEFRLVLVDINQLKQINDVFGHDFGDMAIRDCYRIMNSVFGQMGKCYRLGGDEFACILTDTDERAFEKAKTMLEKAIDEENLLKDYPFSVSLGEGVYKNGNSNEKKEYSVFFHEVDQRMYREKRIKLMLQQSG